MKSPSDMLPLKQWCYDTGLRLGRRPSAVYDRLNKGSLDWPAGTRRVNARVILVPANSPLTGRSIARQGEIRLSVWVPQEARRCGVTHSAIWERVSRGRYRFASRRKSGYRAFIREPVRYL